MWEMQMQLLTLLHSLAAESGTTVPLAEEPVVHRAKVYAPLSRYWKLITARADNAFQAESCGMTWNGETADLRDRHGAWIHRGNVSKRGNLSSINP
jgi:hypothetical protein